ncbi:hypothetical protein V8D89_001966 [Ganoderma adspersum]
MQSHTVSLAKASRRCDRRQPHRPKILLKIAPDLSEPDVADVAVAVLATAEIGGAIMSNTTLLLCQIFARAGAAAVRLYTAFGYRDPGAARAIKDELVELLHKEGKAWREVVRDAVEQHSFRESPPPAAAEPTVEVLHQEAEELKRLLDGLWEKFEESGEVLVDATEKGATASEDAQADASTPPPTAS